MPQAQTATPYRDIDNLRIHMCPSFDCEIERPDGNIDRMHIETEGNYFWIKSQQYNMITIDEHNTYRQFIEEITDYNYLYNS